MKTRKLGVSGKVQKLRISLGGRRKVVGVMKAASSSSLKRWEKKECNPLRAHVRLVNETYDLARRMGMLKRFRK